MLVLLAICIIPFHKQIVPRRLIHKFTDSDVDYLSNPLGEHGRAVAEGFEYSSDKNDIWLGVSDMLKLIER